MKIDNYQRPRSSFLSMEKDASTIVYKMLEDERLKRLLYYTTSDALSKPNLTQDQSLSLVEKNIKLVPKMYVDETVLNYVFISFDDFVTNTSNPEFRDNVIDFDIVCHTDQWNLGDFQLRPYKIAAEIDTLFNDCRLSGIGHLRFVGATKIVLTDEFQGLCLRYLAMHIGEDNYKIPNKNQEEQFLKDFEEIKDVL